ncbi:hypothetical protein ACFO1V_05820 [Daeguia caeni]|uniref:Uncharacterized protein n=1 Tax=Daeguia caeni TaxID=439612 RepID=A0ABV9H2U6_9HYPH
MLSAGSLATIQAVSSLLEERMKAPGDRHPSLFEAPFMFHAARLVGETGKEVIPPRPKAVRMPMPSARPLSVGRSGAVSPDCSIFIRKAILSNAHPIRRFPDR